MLTPDEFIKEHLPHLNSSNEVDSIDLRYAMSEYAQYVTSQQTKPLIEEFVKFAKDRSIRDININDDTILYFLEEKGIIEE
jgi:hypothetical protein